MAIIYCYNNLSNNKKYIGQTKNPLNRISAHKSSAYNENHSDYDNPFHRAIRKYGFENFEYSILAETDDEEALNLLECFFIDKYNTKTPNGYNIEDGGFYGSHKVSEETKYKLTWAQAKLTEEEVKQLRIAYKEGESPAKIYNEKFKDKLHYQSFINIWTGKRYGSIMPEVFKENYRSRTKLTADIVKQIRLDREKTNISYEKLAIKYNISKSTIADIITYKTWKNV